MPVLEIAPEQKEKTLASFEHAVRSDLLTHKLLYGSDPNWPECFSRLKRQIGRLLERLPRELRDDARKIYDAYFSIEEEILTWKHANVAEAAEDEIEEGGKGANIAAIGSRAFKGMMQNVGNERFWSFFERMFQGDKDQDLAKDHKRIRLQGFFGELFGQRVFETTEGFKVLSTSAGVDEKLGVDFAVEQGDKIFVVQVKTRMLRQDPQRPGKFLMPESVVDVMPRHGPGGWERKAVSFQFGVTLSKGEPTPEEMKATRGDQSVFKMSPSQEREAVFYTEELLAGFGKEDENGRYVSETTTLTDAIANFIRTTRGIWIDAVTSERIKTMLKKGQTAGRIEISGRDMRSGLPGAVSVSVEELQRRVAKRFIDESSGKIQDAIEEKTYFDYKVRVKLAKACRDYAARKNLEGKRIYGVIFWTPYRSEFGKDKFFVNEKGELESNEETPVVEAARQELISKLQAL